MSRIAIPEPIYYFGWIIQPTSHGYVVYDRQDHFGGEKGRPFRTLEEAYGFIHDELERSV